MQEEVPPAAREGSVVRAGGGEDDAQAWAEGLLQILERESLDGGGNEREIRAMEPGPGARMV